MTLIAAMDESGFAQFASVANLAHRAIVPVEDAQKAVQALEGPDAESSDPDHEGRRIERVPGGWMVLNADKYRKLVTKVVIQEQTRERVRRHRAKKSGVTVGNGQVLNVTPSEAEAEVVVDAEALARSDLSVEAVVVIPATKKSASSARKPEKSNGRSKHPIFQGQRFVVFDWMLEDIGRILGKHYEGFRLDEWFYALDASAVAQGAIRAKEAWWPWIQAELVLEAQRRGLTATPEQDRKAKEAAQDAEVLRLVREADAKAAKNDRF